ncbi:MAG: metallophosphoesterase [Phycisphaeraceae bacterium]|nr:metallophosphoesterase [Phycisphaeraceae bacterium]
MSGVLSRRAFIGSGVGAGVGIGAAGVLLPDRAGAAQDAPAKTRKRSVRIAHITDTHIEPELRAGEGVAACLTHIRERTYAEALAAAGMSAEGDRVDLILHGGDAIFDAIDAGEARVQQQWDLYHKVLADNWSGPIFHAAGNHDCWGLNTKVSGTTGEEQKWGKVWAVEALKIPAEVSPDPKRFGAYYSFDQNGWHIVVLDSVQVEPGGYFGGIDDAQFEWLRGDLLLNKMHPTLVMSHISLFTATVLDRGLNEKRERVVHPALMCIDYGRLKKLFLENPQVKLALSGHMHLIDRVDYCGVSYFCNGAVSGNWWKGKHKECGEGYAIVDLFDDGTFENRYVGYGWKAQTPS